MAGTVPDVLEAIAAVQRTIAGVAGASPGNALPENVELTPWFINLPFLEESRYTAAYGCRRWDWVCVMRLLVGRSDLTAASQVGQSFVDPILATFESRVTLDGLVTNTVPERMTVEVTGYGGTLEYALDTRLRIYQRHVGGFSAGAPLLARKVPEPSTH